MRMEPTQTPKGGGNTARTATNADEPQKQRTSDEMQDRRLQMRPKRKIQRSADEITHGRQAMRTKRN